MKEPDVDVGTTCDPPLARWLLSQLAARGWTQAEFARRSEIPEATLSSWKRSDRGLSVGHLQRIAATLEVSEVTVLNALRPDEERASDRFLRFVEWMAEVPELSGSQGDFTVEEFTILVGFATKLIEAAKHGATRAIHRGPLRK